MKKFILASFLVLSLTTIYAQSITIYNSATSAALCNGNVTFNDSISYQTWVWTDENIIEDSGTTDQTSLSQLCPGTYAIIVTDNSNNIDTIYFTIADCSLNPVTSIVTINSYSVNGDCNGELTVNGTGGVLPYTYNWYTAPGGTTQTMSNLCGGTHSSRVTDNVGCISQNSTSLSNITSDTANLSISNSSGSCDGSVSLTNNLNFTSWTWTDSTYGSLSSMITLNNLCVGTYYIITIDTLNISDTLEFTINDICSGFSLMSATQWDIDNACIGAGTIYSSGAAYPINYMWSDNLVGTSCQGMMTSCVTDLCMGTYSVIATDANGCVATETITIGDSTVSSQNFQATINVIDASSDTTCNGAVSISMTGGVSPYIVNNQTFGNSFVIDSLCPGFYTSVIYDSNGDTTTISYLITSLSTTIFNNPYVDSTNVDTLLNDILQNCTIDYQNVDSAYVTSVSFITSDSVAVDFTIFNNGQATVVTDFYNFDSGSGVYTVVLNLFCPNKSTFNFLKVYDQIYFNPNLVGTSWNLGLLEEENNFDVTIYPVPFSSDLTINLSKAGSYQVTVFDMTGKQIVTESVSQSNTINLNLQDLSKGQYVVRVQNENTIITRKIVK